jgi:hypothetical protein
MHDVDAHLHELLSSAAPTYAGPDRRPAIRAAARRRQLRRRLAVASVAGAISLAAIALVVGRSADRQTVAARRSAPQATGREVRVAGVDATLRVSTTRLPLPGNEAFGVVPLGDDVITGAVQTSGEQGAPIALVAVTLGPRTEQLLVTPSSGPSRTVDTEPLDDSAVIEVPLERRDPMLTLAITALDARGSDVGSARVAPFLQDPLTCDTNTETAEADRAGEAPVEPGGPPGGATYVAHLDAYHGAPVPAVCD